MWVVLIVKSGSRGSRPTCWMTALLTMVAVHWLALRNYTAAAGEATGRGISGETPTRSSELYLRWKLGDMPAAAS